MKLSLRLGALAWISCLQYYCVQLFVASTWPAQAGYSWRFNTISDLANTQCGQYGARFVCSPYHAFMNGSFVVLGLAISIGSVAFMGWIADTRLVRLGFMGLASGGFGTILVGCFPENSIAIMHSIGAAVPFVLGNVGMLLIGIGLGRLPLWLRAYTIVSGVVGLVALVLFMTGSYFGIGIGGIERIVAYPQSIWMIIFGVYTLITNTKSRRG